MENLDKFLEIINSKEYQNKLYQTEIGNKILELSKAKSSMLNRQGFYSKGVAKLGNRISALHLKFMKENNITF